MRYLVATWDGGGSVPMELGVVRRLVGRGHSVTVLADRTLEDSVMATGAAYRPWQQAPQRISTRPEDDVLKDWECRTPLQQFARVRDRLITGPAGLFAADVRGQLGREQADAVVADGALLGAVAGAESLGVPVAALIPGFYILPAKGMPPLGMGLRPAKGIPGRLRDSAINGVVRRMWAAGLPDLNRARAELGLDPLPSVWAQLDRAASTLVLSSTAYDFPAQLPPNVRYVGPVLDDPPWTEATPAPDGTEPLVVVALSSTFDRQEELLRKLVQTLERLPVRAVVTTGPALDPASIPVSASASERIRVVRSAQHARLFAEAAAVITHAGYGTVIKALAAGVPCLCIPDLRDQLDNAARAEALGAALVLKRSAPAPVIAATMKRLLDEPQFGERAARLGERLRAEADGPLLIQELENLVGAAKPGP